MIIYRGNTEVFEVKDYKQIGKFMDVATIECTVKSPTPIVFKIGDYVVSDYNGLVFSLYDVYPQKKQARSGTYGEAFIYDLKFKADTEQLNICPFLDLVANDNEIVYSSLPSFTTFENVYGIAARIQANMDNLYPEKWRIQVAQTTDEELLTELNEAKEFTISGESCLDGLKKIHDTWGVSYIHTVEDGVNVITIGKSAGTTSAFSYGMGQGLRAVKKNLQNADQLCTRAYVFGSTRNIPARWYNNKGYIGESQYAPNLMIPPSKWVNNVPQGAYIDAIFDLKQGDTILVDADNRIEKYGLKIKTLSYDGSDSSKEEIYPSVNGVTIGNIIDAKEEIGETTYIPSETHYTRTERVDEILEGSQIEDNGIGADADYVLGSDKVTAETKEATAKITIAEQKEGGKYTLLTPQKVVKLCSFKIEKAANYRVDEILDFVTLSKNDYESVISAKLYFQKPSGDYIPLTDNPVTLTDNLTAEVRLHGLTYPLNEVGTYSLILKIEVKPWSVDYVNPQIGDEVYVQYAVAGARVVLGRMENILSSFFTLKLKQIGFNLNDYTASDGSFKTIHVKSGMCSGRTFTITQCSYLETDDSWVITCKRQNDKSLSQRFPNSLFPVSAGDRFVLLNINMPDLYVHTAMQRLYDTAKADLEYLSRQQFVVEPEIDNIQLARSPQLLAEGMYMPIHEEDISIKEDILIDSVTITNRGDQLRTFDVTLRNDKVYNRFNKIASRLSEIETTLQEAQIANNSADVDDTIKTESIGGGSSSAGMDEAALAQYLEDNDYTTTTDVEEIVKPVSDKVDDVEKELLDLGLSVKEINGKKYLESAYDFVTLGAISFGGKGESGGGGGGATALNDLTDVTLGTLVNGQALVWDANATNANGLKGAWVNKNISGGTADSIAWDAITGKPSLVYYDTRIDTNTLANSVNKIGYGYATEGWYESGPALSFGVENYQFQMQMRLNADNSSVVWRPVQSGTKFTWRHFLDAYNYSNYALPKSGGTINGMLTVKRDATVPLYVHTSVDTVYTFMRFKINSVNRASVGAHRDNEYLYRSNSDLSSYYKIYDEGNFNPANYLPLSGGTMVSGAGIYSPLDSVYATVAFNSDHNAFGSPNVPTKIRSNVTPIYSNGTNEYTILHSGNYSSYALPLSGGTISSGAFSPLTIKGNNSYAGIGFQKTGDSKPSYLVYIDEWNWQITSANWADSKKILHSGNIDSYAVTFDKSIGSSYSSAHKNNIVGYGHSNDGWYTTGPVFTFGLSNYYGQIQKVYNSNDIYIRSYVNGNFGEWQKFAFTDSNVASATKLATARTLWGQSFDGSGNVDGLITSTGSSTDIGVKIVGSNYSIGFIIGSGNTNRGIYDYSNNYWWIYRSSSLNTLIPQGNVLIGGTTDYSGKLQVNHSAWDNGIIINRTVAGGGASITVRSTGTLLGSFGINGSKQFEISFGGDKVVYCDSSGSFVASGSITFGSDQRYKDIISDVSVDLETIANAPLFNYKWTDSQDNKEHLGTTAQYWNNTAFKNAVIPTNDATKWTMSYSEIAMGNTIVLAREQIKTKSEVEQLKDRVKVLENRLSKYEEVSYGS